MKLSRYIVLASFLCTLSLPAVAQSGMSDTQVMEYVIQENEKGTSRDQIVKNLVARGVSIEQIRRIRNKYEKEKKGAVVGAKDITGGKQTSGNRLRKSNSQKPTDKKASQRRQGYRQSSKQVNPNDPQYNERQQKLLRESRENDYLDELDYMLTDSLDLEDEWLGVDYDELDRRRGKKQVFGRNIFNSEELSFEPNMNIAAPADYRLGPGDEVIVDVFGASQESFECTVSAEGEINIEGYGPLYVDGLTVEAANARLRQTLGARYQSSSVRLTVGQTRTMTIHVFGEVEHPGTYTVSAFATVFHALYLAGGTNDIGTLRNIQVFRGGKCVSTCDVYAFILNGQLKGNIRLEPGDVIVVNPYESIVEVTGKVRRPMLYEMKKDESLATLLKYAGGTTGDAYTDQIRVVRKAGGMLSVFSVSDFDQSTFQMMDGDSVAVDSTLQRYRNMVEVKGAAWRPGLYQMDGNITTVRELLTAAGGLQEDAFTARGIIHRRKADRSLEVISVDLQGLLDHTVPDIALQNEDVLFIPSKKDMQEELTLKIDGEVVYPGTYDYAENITLEDFILQAGGLKDAASLVKVDINRRLRDHRAKESTSRVAEFFSFELKEGFVVDGEPGFRLEPFDEVYVRRSPGYVEQQHVSVDGEIAFPGTYALTSKGMRLSDVVKMAGGLTGDAYTKGARLERLMTAAERLKQKDLLKLVSSGDSIDMRKIEMNEVKNVGINLALALQHEGDDRYDLMMQDGDRLFIPQYTGTVSVAGEVLYPNTVNYMPGKKLKYYIEKAGGYGLHAKKSRVFALNANGTTTRLRSAKDIEPGATILVPTKAKKQQMSLAEILSVGSIVATLGMVVATLVK